LRLRIASSGLYTYPDVVVICGEPKFTDDRQDTLVNPSFIAEVLSPSTEAYDRGFKSAQYRTIESLQEYALVSQVEARVEVLRRQPGAGWVLVEFTGLKAVCDFASLKLQIKLADIYEKVVFTSEDVIPPRPPVS
jgi:Uma2 family endonuclease